MMQPAALYWSQAVAALGWQVQLGTVNPEAAAERMGAAVALLSFIHTCQHLCLPPLRHSVCQLCSGLMVEVVGRHLGGSV